MAVRIIPQERQGTGQFNNGEILENKPIGFPREGGELSPYSSLFYWAHAWVPGDEDSLLGLHPHQGFEIMSFILEGSVTHYDTKNQTWIPLKAGDAQIIRSGSGIQHAEKFGAHSSMFQIWVDPGLQQSMLREASYTDYPGATIPERDEYGLKVKTYLGKGGPMQMETPGMSIEKWSTEGGTYKRSVEPGKIASAYVISGAVTVNGEKANSNDFIRVDGESSWEFTADGQTELFVIESLAKLPYLTYNELMTQQMNQR